MKVHRQLLTRRGEAAVKPLPGGPVIIKPAAARDPDWADEAIGRLLIVGFEGQEFSEVEALIREVRPAGLIFFKRNYPGSPGKLRQLIAEAQRLAEKRLGRRLFMAIDHEGGLVRRLPPPYTQLPSAQSLAAEPDLDKAVEQVAVGARELAATGFNFNMAPVLDLAPPGGGFIGSRAFSDKPEKVAALGRAWLEAFHRAGILGAGKHFPGLGEAVIDPHHQLPLMDVSLERLETKDLQPFRALIGSGLAAVMTTHALYPALDADRPATFSGPIVRLVKNEAAFAGAVLTDDLEMGAAVENYPLGEAAVQAIAAGHDLALICRRRPCVDECRQALIAALRRGRLSSARLEDAHRRSGFLLDKLRFIEAPADLREEWFAQINRAPGRADAPGDY